MKHIYFISGFGADERVFAKLDFGENELHFIAWKIPERKETIASYALRMRDEITDPNPILIGLSFGGMMCVEIAKIISTEKIILISSIATIDEMPVHMRLAARLHIHKIFPLRPSKLLAPLENYNLGVVDKEEKELVREYRKNIDPQYCTWAIEEILNWKNDWYPPNVVHIHGAKDRIFPVKYIRADYVVPGGGHLLLMNKANKVNEILKKIIPSS
ncbi:MAG: alpha/beta hydrolase [Bacteroidota bacterium]|nr:alpha/beta hydrolase [Bacteroidota bacterium]